MCQNQAVTSINLSNTMLWRAKSCQIMRVSSRYCIPDSNSDEERIVKHSGLETDIAYKIQT